MPTYPRCPCRSATNKILTIFNSQPDETETGFHVDELQIELTYILQHGFHFHNVVRLYGHEELHCADEIKQLDVYLLPEKSKKELSCNNKIKWGEI